MPMSFPTTGTQTDVLSEWVQTNKKSMLRRYCCVVASGTHVFVSLTHGVLSASSSRTCHPSHANASQQNTLIIPPTSSWRTLGNLA